MFLRPFGLYCNACFGILFVSILCTCCNHFSWYCFISFTVFCAPIFSLIHRFFSLSSFVIQSKCLKNFIFAASKLCSSLNVVPLFSSVPRLHYNLYQSNNQPLQGEGGVRSEKPLMLTHANEKWRNWDISFKSGWHWRFEHVFVWYKLSEI